MECSTARCLGDSPCAAEAEDACMGADGGMDAVEVDAAMTGTNQTRDC